MSKIRLIICFILSGMCSGCFFVPSMNLPLSETISKPTVINDTQFTMLPLIQSVNMKESSTAEVTPYYLGINDVISVNIWGHPEFNNPYPTTLPYGTGTTNSTLKSLQNSFGSGGTQQNFANNQNSYVIDNDGTLFFPLIGRVKLAGLTIQQAQNLLTKRTAKYVVNPQVSINIVSFRSQRILVMGEVNTPQLLALSDVPLTLASAIGLAGGINSTTANVEQVYVLRPTGRHTVTAYWIDLSSASAMVYAQYFNLHANDVVYVSTAGLAQFNRVMNQLLPTAETLWYTKTAFPSTAGIWIN